MKDTNKKSLRHDLQSDYFDFTSAMTSCPSGFADPISTFKASASFSESCNAPLCLKALWIREHLQERRWSS